MKAYRILQGASHLRGWIIEIYINIVTLKTLFVRDETVFSEN